MGLLIVSFPRLSAIDRQFEQLERQRDLIARQKKRIAVNEVERSKKAGQRNKDGSDAAQRLSVHAGLNDA